MKLLRAQNSGDKHRGAVGASRAGCCLWRTVSLKAVTQLRSCPDQAAVVTWRRGPKVLMLLLGREETIDVGERGLPLWEKSEQKAGRGVYWLRRMEAFVSPSGEGRGLFFRVSADSH